MLSHTRTHAAGASQCLGLTFFLLKNVSIPIEKTLAEFWIFTCNRVFIAVLIAYFYFTGVFYMFGVSRIIVYNLVIAVTDCIISPARRCRLTMLSVLLLKFFCWKSVFKVKTKVGTKPPTSGSSVQHLNSLSHLMLKP